MEITFLGSANAFAAEGRYWSSFIVDGKYQFDAPPTLLPHLKQLGVSLPDIEVIFITHQHADHIGGLEELALTNTYAFADPETGKGFKPQIISSINVLVNLWDTSLKGGMGAIQGRHALLQDYFFILALKLDKR